jgi:hypothetical protein
MTNQYRKSLIMVSGYAGSGKDTLADLIMDIVPEGRKSHWTDKFKFADQLKNALQDSLGSIGVDVDVFTEDREEKAKMRPLLVEFGRFARSKNKDVFVNMMLADLDKHTEWATEFEGMGWRFNETLVISDLRYLNELTLTAKWCKDNYYDLHTVYIEKNGCEPANDEECDSLEELLRNHSFSTYVKAPPGVIEPIKLAAEKIYHSL